MCQAWWAASPESSIPAPPLLPLRGRRAPHLLRFRSRDDQVFMPSMLCCPRQATRTRGTLEGASRHSRQRGRGDRGAAGLPSHHALLLPLPPGAGNTGRRQGGPRGSRDSRRTREWCPRSPAGGQEQLWSSAQLRAVRPARCAPACQLQGLRGGAGGLGSRSSLSRRPQERPAPLRPRPRWRLHAPPAVAAQSPRSNHLIPFPLGGAAHLLPATPRARGAPAVVLLSAPPRPARGPGSPRSPALDNALVKTAELFLTSPPPLLIKAPPLTVQVPSIKFAEPKPLIGAAFHFSILRVGAPQTWALAHFSFVFFIREKEGDGYQERRIGKQPKGWDGGSREARWGPFPCASNSHTGAIGHLPRSPPDVS